MSAGIYTGGGDRGETRLWDGQRVSKRDPRIELNGTLDEAGALIGLARGLGPAAMQDDLLKVQRLLQDLMAYVARGRREAKVPAASSLEAWIDELLEGYPMRPEFVLPGDSPAGGALHAARAVARRAERVALPLWDGGGVIEEEAYRLINRLSDLLYVLAHKADVETQVARIVRTISEGEAGPSRGPEAPAQEVTLDEALKVIECARTAAEAIGLPVVVAVCSPDAVPVAFQRMKDSLPVSVRLSASKAATALKMKMDTDRLAPLVQPGAPLYGLNNDPDIVAFGGGRLLMDKGAIVGAVGVSGGTVEQDTGVADAAVRCFEGLRRTGAQAQ